MAARRVLREAHRRCCRAPFVQAVHAPLRYSRAGRSPRVCGFAASSSSSQILAKRLFSAARSFSAMPRAAASPLSTPSDAAVAHDIVEDNAATGASLVSPETLTDTFGRQHTYLRISLTEKCNLRCTYCMPESGVDLTPAEHLLTTDELMRLTELFVSCGVDKIRLTGGEPLVRRDAADICSQMSALPGIKSLALTSNGLLLKRRLPALVEAGVTGVNVSLDTLVPAKYMFITRRKGFERVVEAIDASVEAGLVVKVNCVVMKGLNEEEIVDFVEFTRDRPVDVRFIEYMPFDDNAWSDTKLIPYMAMLDTIREQHPTVGRLRNSVNDTAKTYKVPGFEGQFGFISSMTSNFCGGCNRLRLTADGSIKACLFGAEEFSLRDMMRSGASDEDLLSVIKLAVQKKHKALGGNKDMYGIAEGNNRPMITIGG